MPETNAQRHALRFKTVFSNYKKIILNLRFIIPAVAYAFLVGIFFVWMFESPFVIIESYHKTSLYYGLAQTYIFSCFFLGAYLTRLILKRNSLSFLIKIALLITVLADLSFVVSAKIYDSLPLAIFTMMLISTGTSMLFGPLNRIAIEAAKQPMGSRTAVFSTLISVFGALIGWILAKIDIQNLLEMSITISICAFVAVGLILAMLYAAQSEQEQSLT